MVIKRPFKKEPPNINIDFQLEPPNINLPFVKEHPNIILDFHPEPPNIKINPKGLKTDVEKKLLEEE